MNTAITGIPVPLPPGFPPRLPDIGNAPADLRHDLTSVLLRRELTAVFQPILDFRAHAYIGFEGLIRGPAGSPLHTPGALFAAARHHQLTTELEQACRETIFRAFAARGLPGKLFINASPGSLGDPRFRNGATVDLLRRLGLQCNRIVIELTENEEITRYPAIQDTLAHYRDLGYRIAIDDLGEGFSNLRMWSEVRPDFVKIDRHFISGIAEDTLKFQFVRAMQSLAESCSAQLIAEGIENEADCLTVRDLGIACGQGYLFAMPVPEPRTVPTERTTEVLARQNLIVFPSTTAAGSTTSIHGLARPVPPVSPGTPNDTVFRRFEAEPDLMALPVVEGETPLGLISRQALVDRLARPFRRELYGRKSCVQFMDPLPLLLDRRTLIHEAGRIVSRSASHHLADGFIVTDNGRYLGIGSGHDLMAMITEMQIKAARYANPLTQLPGNVPINEHIDRLLGAGILFSACYFDIDHFKPFNDAYGYRRGDDVIQLLGQILGEVADARVDFVGHIGGDDFIVLFQSPDWEARCHHALQLFASRVAPLFAPDDLARGGYAGENRRGERVLHPLPALSIGALPVCPGHYESHREISSAAADAKKQAKKTPGNSLFIERRRQIAADGSRPLPANPRP